MSDPTDTSEEAETSWNLGGTRCTAKSKQTGQRCRRRAHPGATVCVIHGARAPQVQAAIEKRHALQLAHDQVELWGGRRDIHPAEALLELVQTKAAEVAYWRFRVAEIAEEDLTYGVTKVKRGGDDHGTTEEAKPHIALTLLHKAEADLAAYAAASLKAGVDEARVRIAEQHAVWAIGMVRRAFELAGIETAKADAVLVQVTKEAIEG